MRAYRSIIAGLGSALVLSIAVFSAVVLAQRGAEPTPNVPMPPPTVPVVQAPRMPIAPAAMMGASVTPALEGWVKNADGTTTILIGYMNRNQTQTFDIPIGPNNHIDPGGPDFGQPTFFSTGRNYGVFSITVPKDWGTKRLTYTIVANGQPQSITLGIANGYMVLPYERSDTGNTPPVVKVEANGPEFTGPPKGIAQTLSATVGDPLSLTLYATDKGNTVDQLNQFGPPLAAPAAAAPDAGAAAAADAGGAAAPAGGRGAAGAGRGGAGGGRAGAGAAGRGGRGAAPAAGAPGASAPGAGAAAPAAAAAGGGGGRGRGNQAPITMTWFKHRGPAGDTVKFDPPSPPIVADADSVKLFKKPGDYTGKATTKVTFSEPGEYWLRAQVNDSTGNGGGGDQCCWTNVHYKVNVKAAGK